GCRRSRSVVFGSRPSAPEISRLNPPNLPAGDAQSSSGILCVFTFFMTLVDCSQERESGRAKLEERWNGMCGGFLIPPTVMNDQPNISDISPIRLLALLALTLLAPRI